MNTLKPNDRLQQLGIKLPPQPAAVANYVPFMQVGSLIFISGQLPILEGKIQFAGKVGRELTVEEGREAARLCTLNILSQLSIACEGDLSRVKRCVRLSGFIQSTDDFQSQSIVMNGASDLIVDLFGEKGRHTRIAVSANSLPLGSAVEVEGIFESIS
ncbi:RidA family protein [Candidatus Neptunochlamydia vexilliferae]|uniref:RidA family protein n=1 Tax=Candidatus Neptunichlamydia vexilliferae TaxID=1651774 RepID=UPI00189196A7|nr:RidA family protein [Candidatus Neptunochlamydia vexilliferae]